MPSKVTGTPERNELLIRDIMYHTYCHS